MFLDEIAQRLEDEGVGTVGILIFRGAKAVIPPGLTELITLIETGGTDAARMHNSTLARPGAQIVARATTYPRARALALLAFDALGGDTGLDNITLSGIVYVSISSRQSLTDLGLDGAGRPMVGFNIEVEKQPS